MKKIFNNIKELVTFISEKNITSYAASAAFFMVLSIFPLLILLCSLLPYTGITLDDVLYYLTDVVPVYILDLCRAMFIEYDNSKVAIISVTAILAVWASGKGAYALRTGVATINGKDLGGNFAIVRIKSSIYTVVFILVFIIFMFAMAWGNRINAFLKDIIPNFSVLYSFFIRIRFLIVWIVMTVVFQIMYAFMPGFDKKFFRLFPGALFASVFWSIITFILSMYIDVFGKLSIYGSFVGIIFALLWLYWCMYIVLMGACINHFACEKK